MNLKKIFGLKQSAASKKQKHLFSDTLISLGLSGVVLIFYLISFSPFETFEYKLYDFRAKLRQNTIPSKEIVIVAVDDSSVETIGRWPWSRNKIAELINKIGSAQPAVIGVNMIFSEAERNQGLLEMQSMRERYYDLVSVGIAESEKIRVKPSQKETIQNILSNTFDSLLLDMDEVMIRMDNDNTLALSLAGSSKVVLPMFFSIGPSLSETIESLPPLLSSNTITNFEISGKNISVPDIQEVNGPVSPLELFGQAAVGIGHSNIIPDSDGVIRKNNLIVKYGDKYIPSFALQLAHIPVGCGLEGITVNLGQSVSIGSRVKILTDNSCAMLIDYSRPSEVFQYFSAFDVLNDKIPVSSLAGKIVLMGITATGIGDLHVTPVGHNVPGIEIIANVIHNLINQKFLVRPVWAWKWEIGILFLFSVFMIAVLPRLKAKPAAVFTVLLSVILLGFGFAAFAKSGYWIKVFYPLFLLLAGYVIITSKHFLITERGKELVEAESIETNKMLGLSFQGQGMLDIAFEKFRKCPVDDSMKEILYNLGLDYERKRQLNKAISVYEYVINVDSKFKDLTSRVKMLKATNDAVVIGGAKRPDATVVVSSGDGTLLQKPMLGRYEIEKELGRGAMGIVYLGKDPKINRMVAIKTLKFEDDISEEQLKSVKERFFREAESAGQLSHPNIIKIHDAGEDQEVAYIAMELLDGEDLKKYCEKDSLFPVERVLEIISDVGSALDYAHGRGIVHRDIKPANIMLLKDGSIRVTDFGIARISATSKTQTGTVLGTPSYMSPEQISGAKVDGRADIFSLGVVLFEMLTGDKPFKGEGITQLLYKITTDPHPDPSSINKDIPQCCVNIINKALSKKIEDRYLTAGEMVEDIRACLKNIK